MHTKYKPTSKNTCLLEYLTYVTNSYSLQLSWKFNQFWVELVRLIRIPRSTPLGSNSYKTLVLPRLTSFSLFFVRYVTGLSTCGIKQNTFRSPDVILCWICSRWLQIFRSELYSKPKQGVVASCRQLCLRDQHLRDFQPCREGGVTAVTSQDNRFYCGLQLKVIVSHTVL